MKPLKFLSLGTLVAICLIPCTLSAAESSRKWTSTTGQSFEGTYVSSTAAKVTIRRTDGKVFEIERSKLSQDDQTYVDLASVGNSTVPAPEPDAKPAKPSGKPNHLHFDDEDDFDYEKKMLLGYDGSKPNFGDPWPKDIGIEGEPEITVIEESPEKRRFVYESPHFHFESNVLLRPSLLAKVAIMFEATYKVHHDIPLNNRRTRSPKAAKLKARLFETSEEYLRAGGPQGSAGVYKGGHVDEFMVPLDELGVKKVGSGYMFDYKGDFHTMYHEITHQLWADIGDCAGMWMVEGFAEFMACAPYSNGSFSFSKQPKYAIEYATQYGKKGNGGRALGDDVTFPRLEEIMSWDQPTFYTDGNDNYGRGLLLTYFFILMDGEGEKVGENFKNCIKACQEGKSEEDAREVLLAGRSYEQLEKEFASAMKKKGIKITYQ